MAKILSFIRLRNMETTAPSAKIHSHRDLIIWQKGMDLAGEVYRLTKSFPSDELFSLVSQLRRSASSIPANIAEGRGRYTAKDFAHSVSVARGSVMEVDTFLRLALRLAYLTQEQAQPALALVAEIANMLSTWSFLARRSELDIDAVRQRVGPKDSESTRRNGQTVDRTFESDSFFLKVERRSDSISWTNSDHLTSGR
jgi:four helix bundle protein